MSIWELGILAVELAAAGGEVWAEHGKSSSSWGFRNVAITIVNDTDLPIYRTNFDDTNVDWGYTNPNNNQRAEDPPPLTIGARSHVMFMGTWAYKNPLKVEGSLSYSADKTHDGNTNKNICNIHFNNTFGSSNVADVGMAPYWNDQKYRLFYNISRNDEEFRFTVLIRKS